MDVQDITDGTIPETDSGVKEADVMLIFPASYTVFGRKFEKDQRVRVPLHQAAYLRQLENFEVNLRGASSAELQKAVIDSRAEVQKPNDPDQVIRDIIRATASLDEDDDSNFLKDGRPDARALTKIIGYTVTAEERDEALGYDEEEVSKKGSTDNETVAPEKETQGKQARARLRIAAGTTSGTGNEGVKL